MGEAKRKASATRAGLEVPDRKFFSEFAVSLFTARWLMITPEQLLSDGKIEKQHDEILKKCHIYLVCRRPMQSVDPATLVHTGSILSGSVIYREGGVERRVRFSHPFFLTGGAVRVHSPYPHREIQSIGTEGNVIRYLPVSALSISGAIQEPVLRDLEVLYIGQAFGDGTRNSFDRLRSHSTLQKILANTHYAFPDDEIQILSFEYKPYAIISSFDGIDKTGIRDHRDDARFPNLLRKPLSEKQQICLAEAGLIRYFQPHYNIVYKDSFPAADQKILNHCLNLDFSALVVEINTEDLSLRLWSKSATPRQHHIARFDLVNPTARRSFFTFVDHDGNAFEMHGTIGPSR